LGKVKPDVESVSKIDTAKISDDWVLEHVEYVQKYYMDLDSTDQLAKGPKLREALEASMKANIEARYKA
jgi:hypothetical protein